MRRFAIVLSSAVAALATLCACSSAMGKRTLFKNGKSDYVIVIPADASKSEETAARELSDHLAQVGDVVLPVCTYPDVPGKNLSTGKCIYVGMTGNGAEEARSEDDEGFTVRSDGNSISIVGGKRRGTLYGVYSFLEKGFGVRWYTPWFTKVPSWDKWRFGKIEYSESPAIQYRYVQYQSAEDHPDWCARNRNNQLGTAQSNPYGGIEAYWKGHTFEYFVPSAKYFDSHPEYFSLNGGKRTPSRQLCLSNPEVLEICKEGMKKAIAENPGYWVYSLSQNDNVFPCECDRCKELEARYGGHSGLLLWFVNQVADVIKPLYPDKYIGTFAYQYTRKPPVGITPRDNVVIRLCSFECDFSHPIENGGYNQTFLDDIQAWSEIAPHLFIWDYVVNFRQYLAPFPNFGVLAANIKTFQKYHAIGIQEEGAYDSYCTAFGEMRAWVLAKLLWDPTLDTYSLVREFIEDYYGVAAPYVQQYFDLCQGLVKDETVMICSIDNNPLYTEDFIAEASEILENARKAVEGDREMTLRVNCVRAQVLYLKFEIDRAEARKDGTETELFRIISEQKIGLAEGYPASEFLRINKR
ncbi:MAG: DUF4838 domain-containing protein [Candidatus Cryptobacteroides sp.]|jgi:hypothetical protein